MATVQPRIGLRAVDDVGVEGSVVDLGRGSEGRRALRALRAKRSANAKDKRARGRDEARVDGGARAGEFHGWALAEVVSRIWPGSGTRRFVMATITRTPDCTPSCRSCRRRRSDLRACPLLPSSESPSSFPPA